MIWRVVHAGTAAVWALLLADLLIEIATTGNWSRQASAAGAHSVRDALVMVALVSATVASALRALWSEHSA